MATREMAKVLKMLRKIETGNTKKLRTLTKKITALTNQVKRLEKLVRTKLTPKPVKIKRRNNVFMSMMYSTANQMHCNAIRDEPAEHSDEEREQYMRENGIMTINNRLWKEHERLIHLDLTTVKPRKERARIARLKTEAMKVEEKIQEEIRKSIEEAAVQSPPLTEEEPEPEDEPEAEEEPEAEAEAEDSASEPEEATFKPKTSRARRSTSSRTRTRR